MKSEEVLSSLRIHERAITQYEIWLEPGYSEADLERAKLELEVTADFIGLDAVESEIKVEFSPSLGKDIVFFSQTHSISGRNFNPLVYRHITWAEDVADLRAKGNNPG